MRDEPAFRSARLQHRGWIFYEPKGIRFGLEATAVLGRLPLSWTRRGVFGTEDSPVRGTQLGPDGSSPHPAHTANRDPLKDFNSSPEIIRLTRMFYLRHARGLDIKHKTAGYWWNQVGPLFATATQVLALKTRGSAYASHQSRCPRPPQQAVCHDPGRSGTRL